MPTSTSEEQNTFVAQEPPGLSGRHHRVSQPTARIEGFPLRLAAGIVSCISTHISAGEQ